MESRFSFFIFRNFLTRFTSLRVCFTVFEFSWFEMNDSTSVKFRLRNCALGFRFNCSMIMFCRRTVLIKFVISLKFSSKESSSSGVNSGGISGGKTKPSPFVLLVSSLSGSARGSLFTINPRSMSGATSASILLTRK